MSSRWYSANDPHFDSTNCRVETDRFGELKVRSIKYGEDVKKGRIEVLGSDVEVGWTDGAKKLSDGASLTLYRRDYNDLMALYASQYPGVRMSKVLLSFTVTLAPLDEGFTPLPPTTDCFQAFLLPPSDHGHDRGSEDPTMAELKLHIVKEIKWHSGLRW